MMRQSAILVACAPCFFAMDCGLGSGKWPNLCTMRARCLFHEEGGAVFGTQV